MNIDYDREPPKELQDKACNSTTMEQCAFCFYAMGSHRFNYCIEGKCTLVPQYTIGENIKWNTPCILKNQGKKTIEALSYRGLNEVKDLEAQVVRLHQNISKLDSLVETSKDLPVLASLRNHDHFSIGDDVVVYITANGDMPQPISMWMTAKVIPGYRHHDGRVSFKLNGVTPDSGDWGCGSHVTDVLKYSEAVQLVNDEQACMDWFGGEKHKAQPLIEKMKETTNGNI